MAGIGEASAILGVAQIGLQLAQTLVTVIGDYRDAATNINRLRDEIHLTSISLQQLGDLAQGNRLIPGRGVLEATNLRERCRGVIWEIRTVIKKGDNPLHPQEITKDDIDVSYFTAWKWALWTKKHLEDPRQELDRLKDSMTLTFVTHMAILANSEYERKIYTGQIPGIKRNVDWAEEKWRTDQEDERPLILQEIIDAGPQAWQEFIEWKNREPETQVINPNQLQQYLESAGLSNDQIAMAVGGKRPASKPEYQAWSLDPFIGGVQMPVSEEWLQVELRNKETSEKMWKIHSKLQPWYKNKLTELLQTLRDMTQADCTLVSLKLVRRSFFRRVENPPSLQVLLKGEPRPPVLLQPPQNKMAAPTEVVTYSAEEPILFDAAEPTKTDEEIIQEQLASYGHVEVEDDPT